MRQLDRDGVFKAVPMQWGIKRSEASQSVALVIEYRILAQLNSGQWEDWSGYEDHSIVGWHYIVKRDGAINQTIVDSLVDAIGWDGNIAATLNDPPAAVCQITVGSEEYNGKSRLKVQWINPEGYEPGGVGGSDSDVQQVDAQFGALLRAAAAQARSKLPAHETKEGPPAPAQVDAQTAPAAPLDKRPTPPARTDDDLPF